MQRYDKHHDYSGHLRLKPVVKKTENIPYSGICPSSVTALSFVSTFISIRCDITLRQAQLNKLDVVIALKLNQLYCMDNAMESQEARSGEAAPDENDKPR